MWMWTFLQSCTPIWKMAKKVGVKLIKIVHHYKLPLKGQSCHQGLWLQRACQYLGWKAWTHQCEGHTAELCSSLKDKQIKGQSGMYKFISKNTINDNNDFIKLIACSKVVMTWRTRWATAWFSLTNDHRFIGNFFDETFSFRFTNVEVQGRYTGHT